MTLLYASPRFLDHDTRQHPECAARIEAITRRLAQSGLDARCSRPDWAPVTPERLARAHAPEYAATVQALAERGGGRIEVDTVVSRASHDVALLAAGAVCDAVERVVNGQDSTALCLVRPPGHHALRADAMGFCLFNNIAVGARMALAELQLDRVLIVDWDVHHGNGTQDEFWTDPQVGFLSIHRYPFYPGTGAADETGAGRGLGTTLNLPIKFGTSRQDYLKRFEDELTAFADQLKPQLVLVSAGFDSHREDPIGSLGLEVEDFRPLTRIVLNVARTHAGGRLVSVLEGGYNVDRLAESVEAHLEELLADAPPRKAQPTSTPGEAQ
jgi:acetoin utilization deacetylase AcuC-like enzyme